MKLMRKYSVFIVSLIVVLLIVIFGKYYFDVTNSKKSVKADIDMVISAIEEFKKTNDAYPNSIDCSGAKGSICIRSSEGNQLIYQYSALDNYNYGSYTLYVKNDNLIYRTTRSSKPKVVELVCPYGFIVVPGSVTYGTKTFCAMKYEAKPVPILKTEVYYDAIMATSDVKPYVYVTQNDLIKNDSVATKLCDGCHLISDAEWLTIAQNVMSVAKNWTSGIVGVGSMYTGYTKSLTNKVLLADTDDENGYFRIDMPTKEMRRTLYLSNGEVIWDLIGNTWEWTSGRTPGNVSLNNTHVTNMYEWSNVSGMDLSKYGIDISPSGSGVNNAPSKTSEAALGLSWIKSFSPTNKLFAKSDDFNGSGLLNSDELTSKNGVGVLWADTQGREKGVIRGGYWASGETAGLYSVYFTNPEYSSACVSFRVAR